MPPPAPRARATIASGVGLSLMPIGSSGYYTSAGAQPPSTGGAIGTLSLMPIGTSGYYTSAGAQLKSAEFHGSQALKMGLELMPMEATNRNPISVDGRLTMGSHELMSGEAQKPFDTSGDNRGKIEVPISARLQAHIGGRQPATVALLGHIPAEVRDHLDKYPEIATAVQWYNASEVSKTEYEKQIAATKEQIASRTGDIALLQVELKSFENQRDQHAADKALAVTEIKKALVDRSAPPFDESAAPGDKPESDSSPTAGPPGVAK